MQTVHRHASLFAAVAVAALVGACSMDTSPATDNSGDAATGPDLGSGSAIMDSSAGDSPAKDSSTGDATSMDSSKGDAGVADAGSTGSDGTAPPPDGSATTCSPSTPLVGCKPFATVGALETGLFQVDTTGFHGADPGAGYVPGCSGTACHSPDSHVPELNSPDAYKRLRDVDQVPDIQLTSVCTPTAKWVDTAAPANSLIRIVVHGPSFGFVQCPNSSMGVGQTMPRNLPLLSADLIACVDAYVNALVGCK